MAKHEVVIHENTGATKTLAPYLGNYIAKETVKLASFCEAIGAKCGLPAIQVQAIISGAFEAWEALEKEALVRIHTDLGVICAVISGSFPTADAAFDASVNALELALRLDDDLKLALTDLTPAIVTDGDLTKLRLDNVVDVESPRPYNVIYGQRTFRLQGFNMVLDDEGATVYLENGLGTTFPVTIDEVVSKQLIKAHTAALLDGGDYKVVIKSKAGDAAGPLQTAFRKVKYLKVQPVAPTASITNLTTSTGETDEIGMYEQDVYLNGENLLPVTGDRMVLGWTDTEGAAKSAELAIDAETSTAAKVVAKFTNDIASSIRADGVQGGDSMTVTYHCHGGVIGSAEQIVTRDIVRGGS